MPIYKSIHKRHLVFLLLLLIPIISHILLTLISVKSILIYLSVTSLLLFATLLYLNNLLKSQEFTQQRLSQEFKSTLKDKNELEKYNQIKDIMLQISYSIIDTNNIDQLFNIVVSSATDIIEKADTASIFVKNEDGHYEYKAVSGFDNPEVFRLKLTHDEVFPNYYTDQNYSKSKIIKYPGDVNIEDYPNIKEALNLGIKYTLATPIIVDSNIYGLMHINSKGLEGTFQEEDITVVEYLSAQLSLAIKNIKLLEKTYYLSRYDGLTGVYHRHYLDELFNNIYNRALRYNEYFCLCVMDLDNLKYVNDINGHEAGDMIIKHFTEVLQQNIRATDILGRYGGDEFVIVFLNTHINDVITKLQGISQNFKGAHVKYKDKFLNISFSYGVAHFPTDSKDSKELFRIADSRMYSFKSKAKALNLSINHKR